MTISKEDFAALSNRFESVGLLPKGKTLDLLENYDFVIAEMNTEAEQRALAERIAREGDTTSGSSSAFHLGADDRITAEVPTLRDDQRTADPEVEPVSKKRSK